MEDPQGCLDYWQVREATKVQEGHQEAPEREEDGSHDSAALPVKPSDQSGGQQGVLREIGFHGFEAGKKVKGKRFGNHGKRVQF